MSLFVVTRGAKQAEPVATPDDALHTHEQAQCGSNWIVLRARDRRDAFVQAQLFFRGFHPQQRQIEESAALLRLVE